MKLIVCIDNNNGMLFNDRRVSRDSVQIDRVLDLIGKEKLYINSFSENLFPKNANIITDENFLNKAKADDYCFVENADVTEYLKECHQVIIYSWNRNYPSDFKFPKNEAVKNKKCISLKEFKGNSHDKITEEIFE